jgi:aquaporin Z
MSTSSPTTRARLGAEFIGTFWLVLGGCGTAVLATDPKLTVGILGVSLAFGLTVLTMAYALGHISGGHFNPAVTVGVALAGRFSWKDVGPYVLSQVLGGTVGAGVLLIIARGKSGFDAKASGFAANGYGAHSPGGYTMAAALVAEIVLTAFFLYIILGTTDDRAPKGFAPIGIGLGLTLIHLISIPVTNTSVNPARSTAVAVFTDGWALNQLWLFWVAPVVGAAIAGLTYSWLTGEQRAVSLPPAKPVLPPKAKVGKK